MRSVVLLSGGIDSTLALAKAVETQDEVWTLTVDYGQRHNREIRAAHEIARYYGVPNSVASITGAVFAGSALTDDIDVPEEHAEAPDETFVPGRNTVLVSLAASYAESLGGGCVVIGANADDADGYPDCRRKFLESFRDTISVGTNGRVWLHAPLLSMTKADIVRECRLLGVPIDLTWSCYRGEERPCQRCGACKSRREAMLCPTS